MPISKIRKMFSLEKIDNSWKCFFEDYIEKNIFDNLLKKINNEYNEKKCWPKKEKVFRVFRKLSLEKIKVIILGQDPYHIPEIADGFSFSTEKRNYIPASLRNIFLELKNDLNLDYLPKEGSLLKWIKQGVFLFNISLTTIEGEPLSHVEIWKYFSEKLIKYLAEKKEIVWIFLGKKAKEFKDICKIKIEKLIITSHPSPYSANMGFFGSKIFSRTNEMLKRMKVEEVDWKL